MKPSKKKETFQAPPPPEAEADESNPKKTFFSWNDHLRAEVAPCSYLDRKIVPESPERNGTTVKKTSLEDRVTLVSPSISFVTFFFHQHTRTQTHTQYSSTFPSRLPHWITVPFVCACLYWIMEHRPISATFSSFLDLCLAIERKMNG